MHKLEQVSETLGLSSVCHLRLTELMGRFGRHVQLRCPGKLRRAKENFTTGWCFVGQRRISPQGCASSRGASSCGKLVMWELHLQECVCVCVRKCARGASGGLRRRGVTVDHQGRGSTRRQMPSANCACVAECHRTCMVRGAIRVPCEESAWEREVRHAVSCRQFEPVARRPGAWACEGSPYLGPSSVDHLRPIGQAGAYGGHVLGPSNVRHLRFTEMVGGFGGLCSFAVPRSFVRPQGDFVTRQCFVTREVRRVEALPCGSFPGACVCVVCGSAHGVVWRTSSPWCDSLPPSEGSSRRDAQRELGLCF